MLMSVTRIIVNDHNLKCDYITSLIPYYISISMRLDEIAFYNASRMLLDSNPNRDRLIVNVLGIELCVSIALPEHFDTY
jgi:hypothetical protein